MRVLLVGFADPTRMPYVNFYVDAMANKGHEIHLLFWNRDGRPDVPRVSGVCAQHEFRLVQKDQVAKLTKIPAFIRYRHYAKHLLKEQSFDLLIVLHTLPGVLLFDQLTRKYRNKFLLDFRDLTFERFALFRWLIARLALHSLGVFVSSDAYRAFLPRAAAVFTSHNLDLNSLNHRQERRVLPRSVLPIRIRFWGLIRHERVNRRVIDQLGNDPRFELHYHGVEGRVAESLKVHAKQRDVANVFFHGAYSYEERYLFARETDILLNLYENDSTTIFAMGNKFYDGIAFYLPQLCTARSYMGERVMNARVGISIDPAVEGFADSVFAYYRGLAWSDFEADCDRQLAGVLEEYSLGVGVIAGLVGLGSSRCECSK